MIEKPKKERRFLKALGRVGEILIQEVLIKIGSNLIKKIGGKKTLPSILFLLASLSLFAQYPATGNKQRLGFQTTGDGLVFRGRATDTTTIKSSGLNNAYFILDTVNNVLFNYIKTKGGWQFSNGDTIIINNNFTQPFDSLFFKTSVATNNVDTAKMRWDSDLGTVVLGMYDKVPNELGFKNFWHVKNQTGSTITKGSIVYANGTVGASGRITVAKFIANGSIESKYVLGITAHDLTNGEDGYVISYGKIRQVNTDTFVAGSILYPSPTTAGVWTDVEPVAPNIDMPIGFCINSHVNNGTIAIRVASGYKLHELHDVSITSPVEKSSLYYSGGLWRDTTAALFVSDTASMLIPYFKDADTTSLNLTSRFAAKLNLSDTASMLTNYLRSGVAASTFLPLSGGTMTGTINRQEGSHDGSASTFYYNILNYFAKRDNNKGNQTAQITFTDRPGTSSSSTLVRTSDIYLMTAKNFSGGQLGQYLDTTLSIVANQDGGRIGISKLNPAYKLDVNGTFNASGASLIGGTLGVTGATTLGSTLAVTGVLTGTTANFTSDAHPQLTIGQSGTSQNVISFRAGSNERFKMSKGDNTGFIFEHLPGITNADGFKFISATGSTQTLGINQDASGNVGIKSEVFGSNTHPNTLYVNGTLGVTGNITEGGLNVLTSGDTTNMLASYLRKADTTILNLNSRFNTKQNTLNGTGFVKANGINITYDNSTYLTTDTAASTYLPLTGGTITNVNGSGNLQIGNNTGQSQYQILSLGGNAINDYGWQIARSPQSGGVINDGMYIYNLKNNSVPFVISLTDNIGIGTTNPLSKLEVHGSAVFNEGSTDSDFRVESDGNANMVFVDASTDRVGIGYASPTKTLDVNGELRIATVTATPTALLGKDASNVVGTVTTVAQTGLMKAGGLTQNTSSVGIMSVAHGLSYEPTQVIATLAQQNSYIVVCHDITATDLFFTVYDSITGNPLNNISVGIFWLAIK